MSSGCEHVFLESRVLRDAIGDYGEKQAGDLQVRQAVERVGPENIFIEIANQMSFGG